MIRISFYRSFSYRFKWNFYKIILIIIKIRSVRFVSSVLLRRQKFTFFWCIYSLVTAWGLGMDLPSVPSVDIDLAQNLACLCFCWTSWHNGNNYFIHSWFFDTICFVGSLCICLCINLRLYFNAYSWILLEDIHISILINSIAFWMSYSI